MKYVSFVQACCYDSTTPWPRMKQKAESLIFSFFLNFLFKQEKMCRCIQICLALLFLDLGMRDALGPELKKLMVVNLSVLVRK